MNSPRSDTLQQGVGSVFRGAPKPMGVVAPVPSVLFNLFIFLVIVEFINLPTRFTAFGAMRPTLLLVAIIAGALFFRNSATRFVDSSSTTKLINLLLAYIVLSLPVVEFPGSVVRTNLSEFVKAIVFFYFAIQVVDTPKRLKIFLGVFVGCQVFRVLEPLYLHIVYGYWGSAAYMSGGQYLTRLGGAPSDVVNPNGLAFVILTAIPFLHYLLLGHARPYMRIFYILLLPALLYALMLTSSRSGFMGLLVIFGLMFWKSRRKGVMALVAFGALVAAVSNLTPQQLDRYTSIFSDNTQSAATRQGRIDGIIRDFSTGLEKPIFGYGLGTSREAKWNHHGGTMVAHNLYAEVFIELGAVGLLLYLAILRSLIGNYAKARHFLMANDRAFKPEQRRFFSSLFNAILVWIGMCLVFSIAQYGLSEYHWYLIGGLSVAALRIMQRQIAEETRSAESTKPVTALGQSVGQRG